MNVVLPASGDDEDLEDVAASGWVVTCTRCGEVEGMIECECCGDVLCPDCWGEGDAFCERCLGEDEADSRPIEVIDVGERYL